jgi:hypothetical protein
VSLWRFAFLLLIPVIPVCQSRLDRSPDAAGAERQRLYLRTGDEVRRLFPGFEGLMADIYWLRTVQYYGGQRAFAKEKTYELLRPLIDITTSLDPRLELAYSYGAIFLSEAAPFGAGKPLEGVEVLERGVRALPRSWRLRWDLGSLWYFFLGDERRAAQVFLEASKTEGAPYWLYSLAGSILVQQDRVVAREIWRRQYENAEGAIKENAAYHLQVLDALDTRDALSALVQKFAQEHGRPPQSLRELVTAGLTTSIPRDPTGIEFSYDPETARVQISRKSRLWRSKYEGE